MIHSNRTRLSFLGLLVSCSVASNIGCNFETTGLPPDNVTASSSGAGGAGGMGEGGMAGAGGAAGTGGGSTCVPDMTRSCYSGDPKTTNIGTCKPGIETCLSNGTGYGLCVGEILPVMEDCVNVGDEDCDTYSDINDPECKCTTAGAVVACDTMMPGMCAAGMGVCAADGRSVSNCAPTTLPSPENCVTAEDDDCDGTAISSCTGDWNWTYTSAGVATAPNDDAIYSVAATADGGYIIAGVVDGAIESDGTTVTEGKAYVAKLDKNHAMVWEKKYSAGVFAVARSVAVDKDGYIIVGGQFRGNMTLEGVDLQSTSADGFLLKLNGDGTTASWVRPFIASNTQNLTGVSVDGLGNICITGFTDDAVDFGGTAGMDPTTLDIFIACYKSDNTYLWHKVFVTNGSQYGRAVAALNNDSLVFLGETNNADVNLGGMNLMKGGGIDFLAASFKTADGTHQWSKIFGKGMDQFGRGIAATPSGDVLLTGIFAGDVSWKMGVTMAAAGGTFDAYVAKLKGSDGGYLMYKQGNSTGTAFGNAIAADGVGHVTVFGSFVGSIDFGNQMMTSDPMNYDTFLVKLKADDWTPLWTKKFGKADNQFGWGLTVAKDGSAVVAGGFYTELEVPPNNAISSTGGSDIFAVSTMP